MILHDAVYIYLRVLIHKLETKMITEDNSDATGNDVDAEAKMNDTILNGDKKNFQKSMRVNKI